MPAKDQDLSNQILDHVLRNTAFGAGTTWAALYTVAPTATTQGTEVSGGSYARQAVTFGAPSGGSASNSVAVTFPVATADWGTVVAVALCASGAGGTDDALYFGSLATSKLVQNGDQVSFAISALSVTES